MRTGNAPSAKGPVQLCSRLVLEVDLIKKARVTVTRSTENRR